MSNLLSDVRLAWRAIVARPGLALLVIATLGFGIGANTAIFSVVHALLLRPFPFEEPDRLVRISTMRGGAEGLISAPEQDDIAALSNIVEDIALYTDQGMYNASGFGDPEELQATIATHNLFRVLGVVPAIGSTYPAETDRTRRFELVISHGLWVRRFGRDPNIVGRTMSLDGAPGYTIHGVLPAGFNFPAASDLFRSSGIVADPKRYERRDLRERAAIARLKPGVSVEQAREQLQRLGERLAQAYPDTNQGLQFHVASIRDWYVGNMRPYALLLFAAVALVLLIACGNTANLLLSRALARDREMAVRLALGAGRGRLIRQVLLESVLLALVGGVLGLVLAYVGIEAITGLVRVPLPVWMRVELDAMTLLFLFGVSLLTGIIAGVLPALRSADAHLHGVLKDGTRGSTGGQRQRRLRSVLVVAEVALALVLVIGAGLMMQSLARLQNVDPGFEPDGVLSFRVELGWRAYNSHDQVIRFNDRILEGLRALPGVAGVALDSNLPISGKPREPYEILVEGQGLEARLTNPFVNLHVVSPAYFQVMGVPIEHGRGFDDGDVTNGQQVTIVSRRLAERLWPGTDAVGKVLRLGTTGTSAPLVVVGIAADVRGHRLSGETTLDLYRPYRQLWAGGSWFVARTRGVDPMRLAQIAPRLVTETDPNQSFFDVRAMRERLYDDIWQQRASGALFSGFAILALALAVIGLYGALSHMVAQQRRDIGVRLAIGAEPRQVVWMVVGRGLLLTGVGTLAGVVIALAAGPLASSLLFEVRAADPLTFIAAPALFLVVALVSCYIPARRAARVDPVLALRAEV